MSNVITSLTTLKSIAKKYHLSFCSRFKYYDGNSYNNELGETLPHYFINRGRVFKLEYFSGCFNPFLVELKASNMVYNKITKEPVFENCPNPKWDTDKFYTLT